MPKLPGIRRRFRLPSSKRTLEEEIEAEIAFHLERREEEAIAKGLTPEEACSEARHRFGDLAAARADLLGIDRVRLRRENRWAWWQAVTYEIRLAARGLLRTPGFTATVVLTLALGIGVNATMFGITDRLLLSAPPHVENAEEVVRVMYQRTPPWSGELEVAAMLPYADYTMLRDEVRGFGGVAAYTSSRRSVVDRGLRADELRVSGVTPGYFPLLGVRPLLGRFFSEEEGAEPHGDRLAVLSYGTWRSRYGGDPGVIGREIEIDHSIFTIVGVAPRNFHGIELEPVHAWIPIGATSTGRQVSDWHTTRAMAWVRIVARLAPGVGPEAAQAEATAAYVALEDIDPRIREDATAGFVLGSVIAARAPAAGAGTAQRSGRIALWLFGVSGLVLVIACANVANLLLARGIRRRREVGVRLALGVSRRRLAGQVFLETVLITLAGAALGLLLAHLGGQFGRSLLMPDFDWTGSPVDRRVLGFAAIAAAGSALLAGLIPVWLAARADVVGLLAIGGRTGSYRRSPLRVGLVVLQATLSVLLLVGAGLFVRSLRSVHAIPLGYAPGGVVLLHWHTDGLDWGGQRHREIYDASLERVRALQDVEAAALSFTVPMWSAYSTGIEVPGLDIIPSPSGFGYLFNAVTPDYFRVMGTRILRGRGFDDGDVAGSAPVTVVTESMARLLWPGEDAVGKCIVVQHGGDPACREVIGVAESHRYMSVEGEPNPLLFLPFAQAPPFSSRVLTVRTRGEPARTISQIRQALYTIEPGLPHVHATLLRDRIDPQLQPWRLGASFFGAFGVLALILAALGLYGVVAYDVAQRTRELGVRMALGARARNVAALVFRDALRVVALGLVIGLAVGVWAAPRLESLLFGVAPRDPSVFAGAALVLLLAGCAAALVPGWRATRIQPSEALRAE